jgi:dephospho-CoA kinase
MKVVGLVGESGTGKTTIAEHLEKKGGGRIDADAIVHQILKDDEEVKSAIRKRFGDGVFRGDEIDRLMLGKIVFSDKEALVDLNRIVHPVVMSACARRLKELAAEGCDYVVVDAALLLEVPLSFDIDLMIALRASRDKQVRRLRAKGGRSDAEIAARLDSQKHIAKSFDRADVVVDANRPKAAVLAEVDQIIRILLNIEK